MKKVVLWIAVGTVLATFTAFSVIEFKSIWRPVPLPAPLRLPSLGMINHISGEDYWYDVATGRRVTFSYHGGIGVAVETDENWIQTVNYVPSCEVFDPSQQAAGYQSAVEEFITRLSQPEERAFATKRLEALTGRRFSSPERWRTWLSVNKPFFYWSASSQKLEVDGGAAAVGEPTKISWKTCRSHYGIPETGN